MSNTELTFEAGRLSELRQATTGRQKGMSARIRRLLSEARGRELPIPLMGARELKGIGDMHVLRREEEDVRQRQDLDQEERSAQLADELRSRTGTRPHYYL